MHAASWFLAPALALALTCAACSAAPVAPVNDAPGITLRGQHFSVEVATTPAEQEHGLMDRSSMPADHGMLFVFPSAQPLTFWMKNTLIPLDMLFFDDAHKLVAIQANAQPCKADPCKLYPSNVPARYVLELNAGTAAKLGVRKGDIIDFSNLSSSATQ
ncbi:MAG: DUF192 domain-containing protein [Proteobacteria bacterium]|nr:DUF192 domain-containing protein [Pseudomonadota bacterium]